MAMLLILAALGSLTNVSKAAVAADRRGLRLPHMSVDKNLFAADTHVEEREEDGVRYRRRGSESTP